MNQDVMVQAGGVSMQLLVVEVKGRRTGHRDRHGLDAFHSAKRRRMARAISCWRAVHPASAEQLLRVKLARSLDDVPPNDSLD